MSIVFAGHDTTYHSCGTVLYYLDQHPEIKKAIMEEVRNFQEPLDFDELKEAPVLNSFIAEAWRLCPPGGFSIRRVTDDVKFRNKWTIRKGQMFFYSAFLPLSDENVYPNPTEFSIARFLPSDHPMVKQASKNENATVSSGLDPHAMSANYPVFSSGAHGCLGAHFARLEMRIFLTRLFQHYDFELRKPKRVHIPVNGWECEFKLIPIS